MDVMDVVLSFKIHTTYMQYLQHNTKILVGVEFNSELCNYLKCLFPYQ